MIRRNRSRGFGERHRSSRFGLLALGAVGIGTRKRLLHILQPPLEHIAEPCGNIELLVALCGRGRERWPADSMRAKMRS